MTWTQQRVEKLWDKLEKLGIRPERLQLEWISAAEGTKFARVMKAAQAGDERRDCGDGEDIGEGGEGEGGAC